MAVFMDTPGKHLSADARRAVTVETVIRLAGRQNPGSITTAAIAAEMQVTQGALFRHFPSKDAIWEAAMNWVAAELLGRIDQASADLAPLAALRAMFNAYVGFVASCPGVPRMLFGELQHPEPTPAKQVVLALLQQYRARLAAQIERGRAGGEIAAEVDTPTAAMLFIGTIQGLVMQSLLTGEIEHMQKQADAVFGLYQRGLTSCR